MNSFQHLPEYAAAAQSYRREYTRIERTPRRTGARRPAPLRRLIDALRAGRRSQRPATN